MNPAMELDIASLTWVRGGIDAALGHAQDALAKAEAGQSQSDQLRFAQSHVHQVQGALSVVGLDGVTQFAEALDGLLTDIAGGKIEFSSTHAQLMRRSLIALGNYLGELQDGAPHQPLRLYPLYAELAQARGSDVPAKSELFFPDLSVRAPIFAGVAQIDPDRGAKELRLLRGRFEKGLLAWLRTPDTGAGQREMLSAVKRIAQLNAAPATRSFWWAAIAFFEAVAQQTVAPDRESHRLCRRIDTQMRRLLEGSQVVAERLVRDVLFHVASSGIETEHAKAVRSAFRLDALMPVAGADRVTETPLALIQRNAREALENAKEAWNRFAAGASVGLPQLQEHLNAAKAPLDALHQADVARLVDALDRTAAWLRQDPKNTSDDLAMDVATALLVAERAVDAPLGTVALLSAQVDTLCARLAARQGGSDPGPLDDSLFGDTSRHAQEKLFFNQLAREIQTSLGQVEQTLDSFFRNPAQRDALAGLASPLKQVEGAFSMLGEPDAATLVHENAQRVAELASGAEQDSEFFEKIAHEFSALGFFVDAMRHGPTKLERFLVEHGGAVSRPEQPPEETVPTVETEVIAQSREAQQLVEALSAAPTDERLRNELRQNLESLREDAALLADTKLEQQTREALTALKAGEDSEKVREAMSGIAPAPAPEPAPPVPEAAQMAHASDEQIDAELLAIFLEEAHEVLETIRTHREASEREPHNQENVVTVRRGFHTLKGSSRMVGLNDFSDAAKSVEFAMNRWLHGERDAGAELFALVDRAHKELGVWVDQLESGGSTWRDGSGLIAQAESLIASLDAPQQAAAPQPVAAPAPAPVEEEIDEDAIDFELQEEGEQDINLAATLLTPMREHTEEPPVVETVDLTATLLAPFEDLSTPLNLTPAEPMMPMLDDIEVSVPDESETLDLTESLVGGINLHQHQEAHAPEESSPLFEPAAELEASTATVARDSTPVDFDLDFEEVSLTDENALPGASPAEEELDLTATLLAPLAVRDALLGEPPPEPAPAPEPEAPSALPELDLLIESEEAPEAVAAPEELPMLFGEPEAFDAPGVESFVVETPELEPEPEAVEPVPAEPVTFSPREPDYVATEPLALRVEEPAPAEALLAPEPVEAIPAPEPVAEVAEPVGVPVAPAPIEEDFPIEETDLDVLDELAELDALAVEPSEPYAPPASLPEEEDEDAYIDLSSTLLELPGEDEESETALPASEANKVEALVPHDVSLEPGESERDELMELDSLDTGSDAPITLDVEPMVVPEPEPDVVVLGNNTISRPLFDLYVAEAYQHVATLREELPRLVANPTLVPQEPIIRAAHTLGGISGTARIDAVRMLAKALEHALARLHLAEVPALPEQAELFRISGERLDAMVREIDARIPPLDSPELVAALESVVAHPVVTHYAEPEPLIEPAVEAPVVAEDVPAPAEFDAFAAPEPACVEPESLPAVELPQTHDVQPEWLPEPAAEVGSTPEPSAEMPFEPAPLLSPEGPAIAAEPDAVFASAAQQREAEEPARVVLHDDIDEQLLPIFFEESAELLRELSSEVHNLREAENPPESAKAVARLLHTLKGSARMAGAMTLGEYVHRVENRLLTAREAGQFDVRLADDMDAGLDAINHMIGRMRVGESPVAPPSVSAEGHGEAAPTPAPATPVATTATTTVAAAALDEEGLPRVGTRNTLRVRADLVDRFSNEAGEIAIARTRIEGELRTLRRSMLDLTENVIRLRNQLREVEIAAETQMQTRVAQAESQHSEFDPLEFDRFTRFQELTRMMAESVGDVTTIQQNLLKNLDAADTALHIQGRLSRDLQQAMMAVRMVPFDELSNRLHRVVRQVSKELGKRATLDIRGGNIEIDRGVLDKMTAPIEHLLRNAIAHGIEPPEGRRAAGKPEIGQVTLAISQHSNEVIVDLSDDGRGLDYAGIRTRAELRGMIAAGEPVSDSRLTQFIFEPGFSTAEVVSEVAGRGVGMDVVKNETLGVGGRVEIRSEVGHGTHFVIHLPLTLAVTQALLVRAGERVYAVPSNMVEQVLELKQEQLDAMRAAGDTEWKGRRYPFHYLPHLLGDHKVQPVPARYHWILLLRSGSEVVALYVDGLRGNQEIVVKNAGPQFTRLQGFTGATVLANGEISLILNPVVIAAALGDVVVRGASTEPVEPVRAVAYVPTIMVVDDSLTVRKITSRLLEREGFRVVTAKDGVDALEQLVDTVPDVALVDIEMPRMDGFDLSRNIRADERLKKLPIIMITSRMADKHRNYAFEIGVNHYLGKPYQEDELLGLIRSYTQK